MLGAFGDAGVIAHRVDKHGDVIVVDKLGIAETFGLDAESAENHVFLFLYLTHEFLGVFERSEGMGVRTCEEFHAACGGKFQKLGKADKLFNLKLFDGCAGDGDGAFESAVALADHLEESICHRHIGMLGEAGDDLIIGEVVEIIVVVTDIEEAVSFQTVWLMYLEIETNGFHIFVFIR